MKFGLNESELKFLTETLVVPLKNVGAKVYVFGSRASGKHKPFSDVDILYCPNPQAPLPKGLVAEILEAMETSTFPYKIDLVNANELASSYRQQIEEQKVEI